MSQVELSYPERFFKFLMADNDIVLLSELKVFHPIGQECWEECFHSFLDRVLLFMEDNVALADLSKRKWHFGHKCEAMELECREIAIIQKCIMIC